MKVGFYQFNIKFGDIDYNLSKVEETLMQHDFDLIVLPELFTTGYLFSSKEEALSYSENIPDGKATQLLIDIAYKKKAYIVGGIAESDNDKVYNTAVIVGPYGYIGKYRKVHLTKFESSLFESGNNIEVFNLNGVIIGLAICYDTWFPELTRILTRKRAQIICHPANFGGAQSLEVIKIRALENRIYTVTCNRIGTEHGKDFDATFRGESQIVGLNGEVLFRALNAEMIFFTEIDPSKASQKRNVMCDNLNEEFMKYKIEENM